MKLPKHRGGNFYEQNGTYGNQTIGGFYEFAHHHFDGDLGFI